MCLQGGPILSNCTVISSTKKSARKTHEWKINKIVFKKSTVKAYEISKCKNKSYETRT